jgi:hypothetical protein
MRWEHKPKTILNRVKRRFALLPVVIENEWVWLEYYYSYTEEGYAGPETIRFNTFKEAFDWLKQYRLEA